MEVPESLAFELIGRKELEIAVLRRQLVEVSRSRDAAVREMSEWRERAHLAIQPAEEPADE